VTPSASTRVFALLGDPVSHSRSPDFQNAALAALGLDAVYVALRCDAGALPGLLRGLAAAGGGGNVTVPHKAAAAGIVDAPSAAVVRTGACNTFWAEEGRVHGENTDVDAVRAAASRLLGGTLAGTRVLVLGAGGAAAGAVCALLDGGAERVVVANRTPERARALLARFPDAEGRVAGASGPGALRGERFDLVVNATSLGLGADDPLPLDPEAPDPRFDAALDLVYGPGGTAWVRRLRAHGVAAEDGTEVLIGQGAASFRRWWGREPPVEAMRASLAGAPTR
jgi:shikimate dehydrogenase